MWSVREDSGIRKQLFIPHFFEIVPIKLKIIFTQFLLVDYKQFIACLIFVVLYILLLQIPWSTGHLWLRSAPVLGPE